MAQLRRKKIGPYAYGGGVGNLARGFNFPIPPLTRTVYVYQYDRLKLFFCVQCESVT